MRVLVSARAHSTRIHVLSRGALCERVFFCYHWHGQPGWRLWSRLLPLQSHWEPLIVGSNAGVVYEGPAPCSPPCECWPFIYTRDWGRLDGPGCRACRALWMRGPPVNLPSTRLSPDDMLCLQPPQVKGMYAWLVVRGYTVAVNGGLAVMYELNCSSRSNGWLRDAWSGFLA